MASPVAPGLLLCFAAMVLLIFVSISSPTWEKISFLDVTAGGRTVHFGVFGFTGSKRSVGYFFDPASLGLPESTSLDQGIIHNLTFALILHPIAAALAALAVLFGLCGCISRIGTIFMTLCSTLATLVTLVAWIIDMVLWGIARNRIRDAASNGTAPADLTAQYGNANWLTLGALVALILGFCAGALGSCGRYRHRRDKVVA